jgi:hypothetical protein
MWRIALLVLCAALCFAAVTEHKELDVTPDTEWTDSGMDVKAGDSLTFSASGNLDYAGSSATPDGRARGWKDLLNQLPLNSAGRGALLGRWSQSPAARPFLVGSQSTQTAPIDGHLYLGINQMMSAPGAGRYHVVIDCQAAPETSRLRNVPLPNFTQSMLNRIPLRVTDLEGDPGDRVNFILLGSEEKVKAALQAAGWVVVDKTKTAAVLHGLLASLSKDAYVNLPMSELELFGRPQDYGYAQADPLKVVASRHHFRLWRCPFTADGATVWAGAGTHDVGFDKDARNNGITHKIDPSTDLERDYIAESLHQTGMAAKQEYMTPAHTIKEARTATGAGFVSDGRTAVIYLLP